MSKSDMKRKDVLEGRNLIEDRWREKYYDKVEELVVAEKKLQEAKALIKFVDLHDCYPDLSGFKYADAFRIIRPKIKEWLDNNE